MLVVSRVTTITKQHYLLINGPMHTRALINTNVQFKCRVQLLIQNIGPVENKCTQMANETNSPTCSSSSTASSLTPSSSASSASAEVWQIIKPNLLPNKLDIIVQWMKDGFGYDRDALRQTFGGRYTMMESKEKDMYDLTINGVRYEDEGEYACQARLVEKSNSHYKQLTGMHQLTASHTKLDGKSINSDRINYDSSKSEFLMHDPFALPMSLIKSNTANLNIVVPPKSINLNILMYENLKSKFLINTKNQYNYSKSSSFHQMIQTQSQQSVWLHSNQSIQLICITSSWSKPLGKIKWSVNNDDIFDDNDDNNKSINTDLSSRISHTFDFHLKRKFPFNHHLHGFMNKQVKTEEEEELFSWLNSAYCDSNYECHIMNRTKKSIILNINTNIVQCTGQLLEFIQTTDATPDYQLYRSWSILNLTFHGTMIDEIPIKCSLGNQNDFLVDSVHRVKNGNVVRDSLNTDENKSHLEIEINSLQSQLLTINVLHISNVFMKIFSNSEILKSSGQQTIVLIENQPVHLGCFYERSHMPANVKYEYTYFIQSKSYIPEEKLGSLQAIGWKSFKNASLLYYQSQQNLVEFLPDRIFNGAKVNCQIRGTRFKSVQADRNILITSNQSMVLSDMEDRRNETSEETLEVTSSQSSIDLNIHYGPDIHNPEDQFYPVYLCTKFNQGSQTSCGNKVTSPWTTSQNIILQCRTDFNPPGQVQWFQWQPSRRSLVYITNGQTLQFNIEQLKDLLKYTEITSHNLWFIDNYFSKNKEVIPVVGEELIFKLWKFICIASSDGFTNQSANRYVVEARKPFVYSNLDTYGVLDKSIEISCNVISFLELNFFHPIWSFNGKYILDDNRGNSNNKSLIVINASSTWNSKISISATHHNTLPRSKYIINNRKYSFGWIITLRINRLLLTDEGVYQCTFTNELGTSSFRINLHLQDKQTVNDLIQIISICLLSLLILPLLLSILFYIRKRRVRSRCSKQQFRKCGLKINWKNCSESQSSNHTRKSIDSNMDGYFMGVDFTEFVQNQLADEMNNNNNNSSSVSGQQSEQMFSVDPMIPLPQKCYNPFCGHMTAQNPAFGKHQSSGESTLYCALTKTCQGQLIHMGIPSESNYLTCPHFKSRISDVNNSSGLDQTAIFHPKTGGQFCTTIPRCSTKFMHNELSYNSLLSNNHKGINSNRRLQYGNSLILHYDHGSDIDNNNNNTVCLNELQLNSMFNESQVCCHECDTNNNSYEYFKFPCHHHLLYCNHFVNNNINENCDNNNNKNNGSENCINKKLTCQRADVVPTDNKAFCYLDKNSTNINNSSNIIQILASTRVHNYSDNEG